ncbi:hypothetical protein G6F32_015749 [Rhizopus arrhizus]|nr:hypothetical protein G6F32_015749 [Rhizopus arrhizus]
MHTFADSTDAMRAAVYGMGAVLARTHIAQPYLQRYEVVRLPGPALKARYAYHVVHAEGQPPSQAARLFIDWLLEQAQDGQGNELAGALDAELTEDRVYALSPKDEVLDLPQGATPLDFAY